MSAPFAPARGLGGRHAQTVYGPLLRRARRVPLRRERWELADGDFLDLDLLEGDRAAPLLLVLHGLEGSSASIYVRAMLDHARARGWRAAALNFRSCSGEPNRLLRSYHSGETGDLDLAARRLKAAAPGAPIVACAFSLGANVLVKWLGERGAAAQGLLAAACAVSTPFDLSACADALDGPGPMAFFYRTHFLRTLEAKAARKAARFPDRLAADRARGARSLREFDDRVTAPVHGFRGAADYYARSSSAQFVPAVRVPLLLLSATDDPFIPGGSLPRDAARANPDVTLEETPRGGHVGWVSGSLLRPRYWAEERAAGWLADRLARR